DAGHHQIEHQTPRFVQVVLREKFAGRRKRGYNEASRAQKARKRFPHRRLIVHDENGWRVWFGHSGHCSSMIPVILSGVSIKRQTILCELALACIRGG